MAVKTGASNNKHNDYLMLVVCCSLLYVFVVFDGGSAPICSRCNLMCSLMYSFMCCAVGSFSLNHATSSVDSGRFITVLSFVYILLMSSSVTSEVLGVVGFIVVGVAGFLVLGL